MSRALTKKQRKQIFLLVAGLILMGATWIGERYNLIEYEDKKESATTNNQSGAYTVSRVEDGDTIKVLIDNKEQSVRLIGVDTPETKDPRVSVQCFGKSASEFTKNLIGTNPVKLEQDPKNSDRDRYNRLLRYVYLPDNRLVNAEIISQGYGFAYTLYPFEKLEEFKTLELQARNENRGLWSACQVNQEGQKKLTNPEVSD